jgi:hypothetical protein
MSTVPDPATTDWVPLFDLGRQPIKYLGDYSATTTYNDGDCVIGPDGISYVCVMDNTLNVAPSWSGQNPPGIPLPVVNGQWIKGVGGAAVWQPLTGYGTSLPASPLDGDRFILVDSVTNPSYQWELRYNAGSTSAYKWEFVGGAPVQMIGGSTSQYASSAWIDLGGGPTFTVPRAGEYRTSVGCFILNYGGAAFPGQYNAFAQLGTAAGQFGAQAQVSLIATWSGGSIFTAHGLVAALAAGNVIRVQIANDRNLTGGSATNFSNGCFTIFPVRVS